MLFEAVRAMNEGAAWKDKRALSLSSLEREQSKRVEVGPVEPNSRNQA